MIIDLDMEKCVSCGACAVACMDQNDTDPLNGDVPFRSVYTLEEQVGERIRYTNLSMACMHCADAPCVAGCPTVSLRKDPDSGLTLYDPINCIGCHSCAMACPFGAPSFDGEGKMVKCDGCVERLRRGMVPACVRVCPTGALTCRPESEYHEEQSERSLRALARHLLEEG